MQEIIAGGRDPMYFGCTSSMASKFFLGECDQTLQFRCGLTRILSIHCKMSLHLCSNPLVTKADKSLDFHSFQLLHSLRHEFHDMY